MPAPALNWNINVYNFCYSLDSSPINLVLRNNFNFWLHLGTSLKSVKVVDFFPTKDRSFGFTILPSICRGEVSHTCAAFSVHLFPFWLSSLLWVWEPLKECVLVAPGMRVQVLQWRVRWGEGSKEWETLGPKMMLKFTRPSIVSISGSLIKLKLNSK